MICLGIESTAHTFGASIVTDKGEVLSNSRKLFTTEKGGLIPVEVSDHHVKHGPEIVKEAIKKANIDIKDIDLIAFSQSPGIGHCLRIGASIARSLSLQLKIPLMGVNHCIAHLEIGRLKAKSLEITEQNERKIEENSSCSDPVLLYASGANTQIIAYEGKRYRIFGETLDLGIGNFLDTIGRKLNLGFPGGPKMELLARKGTKLLDLPYNVKGMDVNFAGMQTKLDNLIKSGKFSQEDICFSVQETSFAMLLEVSERAMAHTGKTELLLGGGVACNHRLQEMAAKLCKDRGAKCYVLPNEFNVDNAAMIAWTGILQKQSGQETSMKDSKIDPYLRTDEVEVTWRK